MHAVPPHQYARARDLQSELEALERRQAQYNSMDKRSGDLGKEVKILQEALADYNTVLDKASQGQGQGPKAVPCTQHDPVGVGGTSRRCGLRLHCSGDGRVSMCPVPRPPGWHICFCFPDVCLQVGSQAPVYVIQQEMSSLRDRNDQQRKRVDEVLTERLNLEAKTKQVGGQGGRPQGGRGGAGRRKIAKQGEEGGGVWCCAHARGEGVCVVHMPWGWRDQDVHIYARPTFWEDVTCRAHA